MKPEQQLYQLVKDHLPGHYLRIESVASVGAPDIELCYEGVSCWIELKCPPKEMMIWDMLRPSQQIWHLKRFKQHGKVFIIYRIANTILLLKAVRIATQHSFITKLDYEVIWRANKPWDWTMFFTYLVGELK